jgi:hypothetical protein
MIERNHPKLSVGAQGTAVEPSLDTGDSYLVTFSKNSKGLPS